MVSGLGNGKDGSQDSKRNIHPRILSPLAGSSREEELDNTDLQEEVDVNIPKRMNEIYKIRENKFLSAEKAKANPESFAID